MRLNPIPQVYWLKRELFKKKNTQTTGIAESRNQRRIDSLLTYNASRLRLRKKDNFINLTIVWRLHKRFEAYIFIRYLMINYEMAIFLLISNIHTEHIVKWVVYDLAVSFCHVKELHVKNVTILKKGYF